MTFDEANAAITEAMTGRVVDHVVRNGLEMEFYFQNSSEVVILQATTDGHIVLKRQDVKIMLPGVSMLAEAGKIGG